jgi:hypothetical protein
MKKNNKVKNIKVKTTKVKGANKLTVTFDKGRYSYKAVGISANGKFAWSAYKVNSSGRIEGDIWNTKREYDYKNAKVFNNICDIFECLN